MKDSASNLALFYNTGMEVLALNVILIACLVVKMGTAVIWKKILFVLSQMDYSIVLNVSLWLKSMVVFANASKMQFLIN